jgi:hypothetical protein
VPSLTPGSWVIAAWDAVLHASLSSAFFCLRQAVISSALGMNALQSLSASGVHAMRCSVVPCEKEGAGKTVAESKASKMRHGAEQVSRSIIHLFGLFTLIKNLPSVIKVDTRHLHGRCKYTLAKACAWSETSAFGAFDPATFLLLPFGRIREVARFGLFRHQHRVHINHQAIARLSKHWEQHQR